MKPQRKESRSMSITYIAGLSLVVYVQDVENPFDFSPPLSFKSLLMPNPASAENAVSALRTLWHTNTIAPKPPPVQRFGS